MKKIAYKVSKNNIQLPDGFITEYIDFDMLCTNLSKEEIEKNYLIVAEKDFNKLLSNNNDLMINHSNKKEEEKKNFNIAEIKKRFNL